MVCRNICQRFPRMQVSYITGGKYCRRCEYYFFTERLFCEYCGMRLRASPANREYKERSELRIQPLTFLIEGNHATLLYFHKGVAQMNSARLQYSRSKKSRISNIKRL